MQILIIAEMVKNEKMEYSVLVKDEYLPPPLEADYLSIFDIEVKAIKQYLRGSEEDKVNLIKRRIKKFFDYGEPSEDEQAQPDSKDSSARRKKAKRSRAEPPVEPIEENLELNCKGLILHGSDVTYSLAEQIFPGFVCFEKIDDQNSKIMFENFSRCSEVLIGSLKEDSSECRFRIQCPSQIEWFQVQGYKKLITTDDQQKVEAIGHQPIFARYCSNKDETLFKNNRYFRKLLAKARKMFEKKELKLEEGEQKFQDLKERERIRRVKKICKNQSWKHSKAYREMRDEDSQTVYDDQQSQGSIHSSRRNANLGKAGGGYKQYAKPSKASKYSDISLQESIRDIEEQSKTGSCKQIVIKSPGSQISEEIQYFEELDVSQILPKNLRQNRESKRGSIDHHRIRREYSPQSRIPTSKEKIIEESLYFDGKASQSNHERKRDLPFPRTQAERQGQHENYRDKLISEYRRNIVHSRQRPGRVNLRRELSQVPKSQVQELSAEGSYIC